MLCPCEGCKGMPKKATTIKSCRWFAEPEKNCGPYARYLGHQECLKELAEKCGDGCGSCSLHGETCRPEETNDYCEFIRIWMSGYTKGLLDNSRVREMLEQMARLSEPTSQEMMTSMMRDYCRSKGWLKEG